MQAAKMQAKKWDVDPVGVGLGTDYSFMDRLDRFGGTADENGQSPLGSGNPADYEQRLRNGRKITSPLNPSPSGRGQGEGNQEQEVIFRPFLTDIFEDIINGGRMRLVQLTKTVTSGLNRDLT